MGRFFFVAAVLAGFNSTAAAIEMSTHYGNGEYHRPFTFMDYAEHEQAACRGTTDELTGQLGRTRPHVPVRRSRGHVNRQLDTDSRRRTYWGVRDGAAG